MRGTDSARAVAVALTANSLLAVAKLAAFLFTGSAAMLSEAIHSLADTANQALLAVGIAQSERPADPDHPYGYGRARYVWSLLSASGVFFIGCGATLLHGVTTLLDPQPLADLPLALGVLALAALLDGGSLIVGLGAVRRSARARGVSTWQYILTGDDPSAVHIVAEDGAAMIGVLLAGLAIAIAAVTGDPRWDAAGSIAIGLLMGSSAVFLINRNRRMLLERAASPTLRARFLAVIHRSPFVEEVHDLKATVIGPDAVKLKAEVEFDGHALAREYLEGKDLERLRAHLRTGEDLETFLVEYGDVIVQRLGDEVDRLEAEIQREVPETRHIDLETN